MSARRKLKAGVLATGFPSRRDEAVLNAGGVRADSALYDFSVDGGAVSTISLGRNIPAGAIVTNIITDELTALTSDGAATVQVKAGSTALTDALAFDTAFTGADTHALASSAEAIKVSAESEISIAIATAALTAGKLRVIVQYVLPND